MNADELARSTEDAAPPPGLTGLLRALWHEARGEWKRAHEITQSHEGADAAWVHAYLHRVEGDLSNAAYWYRRASRTPATGDLGEEWREIADSLCAQLSGDLE